CSTNPLNYCPTSPVTRAQMAVFLEKGLHGAGFTPANVAATFTDTAGHWAEDWIEALKSDGVTSGCGAGIYCPENSVTRDQMAVFLLKAKYGSAYTPPAVGASTGFTDVPSDHWAAAWIKQLAAEAITGGCGGGLYCPSNAVTRDQMAVFLVRTFNLP
ncbi:MAG TPA: S-layer homology domain-containing protein, partial [Anaerolineales bacterium]|nr:S-layer homology domain-containing protein [Anaerolineales bacterium]